MNNDWSADPDAAPDFAVDPDIDLIALYLADEMPAAERQAVDDRLARDPAFRARVEPLMDFWRSPHDLVFDDDIMSDVPSMVEPGEVDRMWERFRREVIARQPAVAAAPALSPAPAAVPNAAAVAPRPAPAKSAPRSPRRVVLDQWNTRVVPVWGRVHAWTQAVIARAEPRPHGVAAWGRAIMSNRYHMRTGLGLAALSAAFLWSYVSPRAPGESQTAAMWNYAFSSTTVTNHAATPMTVRLNYGAQAVLGPNTRLRYRDGEWETGLVATLSGTPGVAELTVSAGAKRMTVFSGMFALALTMGQYRVTAFAHDSMRVEVMHGQATPIRQGWLDTTNTVGEGQHLLLHKPR